MQLMPTCVLSANYEVLSIWIHSYQFSEDKNTVSLTLSWLSTCDNSDPIEYYNIYTSVVMADSDQSSWRSDVMEIRWKDYQNELASILCMHCWCKPRGMQLL